ncbi:MAG: acetyl-CoA C-acyltransferase [Planctomycetota bacterium]|nr:MAG: acetyl-CoA C-acyltransferase [Planctomycetota bacterium]
MTRSVIVGAKRSPMGKFLGTLSPLTAPEIGAQVARKLIDEVGCPYDAVDWALIGQVLQAGVGQNPARQVALKAGLPPTITAVTVNQVCGSGLRAAMNADNNIRLDQAKIILTGGMESMSNAPYYVRGTRTGATKFGHATMEDGMLFDGLTCPFEGWGMGHAAEYTARKYNISREDQDAFALESHHRAAAAQRAGAFKKSIAPIEVPGKKGPTLFGEDESIRPEVTLADLQKLKPAFEKDGTVTAGNSSQLTDGAAMALLASEEEAKRRGWPIRARIIAHTTFGVPPKELFIAPVGAVRQLCDKVGVKVKDIDLFEINEAFACQMLACMRQLEISHERVNVLGGAIALGHPIGCSGTRVLTTLLDAMEARGVRRGIATLCLGGGNAVAMMIERP